MDAPKRTVPRRRFALCAACCAFPPAPAPIQAGPPVPCWRLPAASLPAALRAYAPQLAGFAFLIILLLTLLALRAYAAEQQLRRQNRRYMLLSDASDEFIYEYDVSRDLLTLTAKCASLLGAQQTIPNYRHIAGHAIRLSDGRDMTEGVGEAREVTLGWRGTFRVVNSAIKDANGKTEYIIGKLVNISEERKRMRELVAKSETDGMTGIGNAAATREAIGSRYAARETTASALFMIDVDHFKAINDSFGHYAGDRVLTSVAAAMRQTFRAEDIIGRVGGDEFCAYMGGELTESIVRARCEALRSCAAATAEREELPRFTLSIGVLLCGKEAIAPDEAYQLADAALYEVKQNGRNGFHITTVYMDDTAFSPHAENR